jgi:anti-sigma B factor antagonist
MLVKMSENASTKRLTVTAPNELSYPLANDFSEDLTVFPPDGELVIDLRHVDFMDASGVRALLIERKRRQSAGGSISLRNPPPLVLRLLEVTGVNRILPIR